MVRFVFLNDKQDAVLGVYSVSYYHRASQAELRVVRVTQWQLVLQGLPLDFRSYRESFQRAVLLPQSPAVVLEDRSDFLLWTSAGCQPQLGELLACALSLSAHFSPLDVVVCICARLKAQWIWTEIIVSPSLHLALLPCCCNDDDNRAAASKQPQSILEGGGSGWGADYPGPPAEHRRGMHTANNTDMMLLETSLLQYIHWWKKDSFFN